MWCLVWSTENATYARLATALVRQQVARRDKRRRLSSSLHGTLTTCLLAGMSAYVSLYSRWARPVDTTIEGEKSRFKLSCAAVPEVGVGNNGPNGFFVRHTTER